MSTSLWKCALMLTSECCPIGKPGHWHHDLISHSITLPYTDSNQYLPYPNNAKHLVRKWQVLIVKLLVWLDQGSNPRVLIPWSIKYIYDITRTVSQQNVTGNLNRLPGPEREMQLWISSLPVYVKAPSHETSSHYVLHQNGLATKRFWAGSKFWMS